MINVVHDEGRFHAKTTSGEAELLYRMINGDTMSIYHTFVPEGDRGKGIAEVLAAKAFEFAKEKNYKVRPDCPYIPYFLSKHPELKQYAISQDQPSGEACPI